MARGLDARDAEPRRAGRDRARWDVLGGAGINIASYHQARRATPGQEALAAINVDQALKNGVLEELQRLPDVLDVRLAYFGD